MQFFLPQNLATELIPYDPTLKKLARTRKPGSTSTKPKFPLGQPYDIIPSSVIKTSLVQDAVDHINSNPVKDRVHEFRRIVGVLDEAKSITTAILYHYESCWYAAWLPPAGQEGEYVYGYSYAYKDTASARGVVPHKVIENIENCSFAKYGRSEFITYTAFVTKESIISGNDTASWSLPSISWNKGEHIRTACDNFVKALRTTVPTWDEGRHQGVFRRLLDSNWTVLLDVERVIDKELARTWKPSVDALFKIIDNSVHFPSDYCFHSYRKFAKIQHIIDKPFFRKWIQSKCEQCIERFADTENKLRDYIRTPWEDILALLESIYYVNNIWPNCPIDHYQTNAEILTYFYGPGNVSEVAHEWLRTNMPVASFFQILAKHTEDTENTVSRRYFSDWRDTVSMISTVLASGNPLETPKRWRITEFHDHVQAEAWKIQHTNQSLPQDLFPAPIKVQANDQTWTFIQPHDLHQLAAWGQAVRNCVGNASHYADDVKKKKHFIVLAMVDNKPLFTIQLEVNNGMMSVKQIKGVANKSLSDSEKDAYTAAFGTALNKRNEELVLNPA